MKSQLEAFKEYIKVKLKPSTNVISVISGKGGVGKTNLSVNLGLTLQSFGFKVILIDLDLGLSNLDVLMNIRNEKRYNLSHYLEGRASLDQLITKTVYGVDVITGALGEEKLVNMSNVERDNLIANLDSVISNYNFVILDMGAGIGENIVKLSLCADNIIVVTNPEPHALLAAYGTLKVIKEKIVNHSVFLVMNSVKNKIEGEKLQNGFIDTVYKFLNIMVEPLGYILYDPAVSLSVKDKIPFTKSYPKSYCSENVETVAINLCTKLGIRIRGKKTSFFSRLFKNFI